MTTGKICTRLTKRESLICHELKAINSYLMKLFSITYITSKLDKRSNILRIYLVYRLQLINAQLVNEQMKSLFSE